LSPIDRGAILPLHETKKETPMDLSSHADSKTKTFAYWIVTALVALAFLAGGLMDIGRGPAVAAIMAHLGYPLYLAALLGAWKLAGAAAIVAPGLPRLKEWAYAGMFFDLSGAAVSHAARGDGARAIATPLVLLALVMASWALRPQSRTLAAPGRHERARRAPARAATEATATA
jgi:uncharacterized membrane protein YphA (DoxX/SURF4 family)